MFNFRLGQAMRYAFAESLGDYVIVLDADLSYSPEHIGKMLAKIKETRAKIIIASPFRKGGKVSNVPWRRKKMSVWANRFLSFLATGTLFSNNMTNITGMVRTYDGDFIRKLSLRSADVEINSEIIYKAKILRARIDEIPAHLNWRTMESQKERVVQRKSSMRIRRSIIQNLLSGFIIRPVMFFILPGLALFLVSMYPITWTVIHTVNEYNKLANFNLSFDNRFSGAIAAAFRISPHAFIVGGIVMMVAIQLITLGFLAFQKKRYFEELFYLTSHIYNNTQAQKKISFSK
jgi:glycosyltransferase involved in cell wall biosynthesis